MSTYNQSPCYTVGAQQAKSDQRLSDGSQTQNELQYVSFTTLNTDEKNCTEHKPGHLHAATQWTHAATATPPPTHTNVTTNVNGMSLYDFYVLRFDSVSAKSLTVKPTIYIYIKLYIYTKKNPQNCIFLVECKSEVYNLSALCCKLEWLNIFFFFKNIKEVLLLLPRM